MDVWSKLGIEPTDDLLAIRSAKNDITVDDAESEELRVARETAALWCAGGYPPSALKQPNADALRESLAEVERERGQAEAGPSSATESARRFFDPETFPAEHRQSVLALRPYIETFTTSLDREAPGDEQRQWLEELIRHPGLDDPRLRRDLGLLLPMLLLNTLPSDETIELVSNEFWGGGVRGGANDLHRALIAEILGRRNAIAMLEELRDEAAPSFRMLFNPDSLAANVLLGGFRPTLFLYARCKAATWDRIQQRWNELGVIHPPVLRQIMDSETYDYWDAHTLKTPPPVVDLAQTLQMPAWLLGGVVGLIATVAVIGPHTEDPSLVLWAPVATLLVYGSALGCHFGLFALVWMAHRLSGN